MEAAQTQSWESDLLAHAAPRSRVSQRIWGPGCHHPLWPFVSLIACKIGPAVSLLRLKIPTSRPRNSAKACRSVLLCARKGDAPSPSGGGRSHKWIMPLAGMHSPLQLFHSQDKVFSRPRQHLTSRVK